MADTKRGRYLFRENRARSIIYLILKESREFIEERILILSRPQLTGLYARARIFNEERTYRFIIRADNSPR